MSRSKVTEAATEAATEAPAEPEEVTQAYAIALSLAQEAHSRQLKPSEHACVVLANAYKTLPEVKAARFVDPVSE